MDYGDRAARESSTTQNSMLGDNLRIGRVHLRVRRVLAGHLGKVCALDWSRDSRFLVSAAQDGYILVWDVISGNKIHSIGLAQQWLMACTFGPSGTSVACGGMDNKCSVFNLKDQGHETAGVLLGHEGYVSAIQFLRDEEMLTSSGDSTIFLWDLTSGRRIKTFSQHENDVTTISAREDCDFFLSGGVDQSARLWDVRMGSQVATFTGHKGDVTSVKFFPNQTSFLTSSEDSTCRLFDIRVGKAIAVYRTEQSAQERFITQKSSDSDSRTAKVEFTSVACSSSGRLIFGGSDNNLVYVWDTLKSRKPGMLHSHIGKVSCLAVAPDGRALATGSWDRSIRIWN